MVAAGLVEYKRLQTSGNCTNYVAGRYVSAKSLSIFYQVPQFAIMGISEIFVMITGMFCFFVFLFAYYAFKFCYGESFFIVTFL